MTQNIYNDDQRPSCYEWYYYKVLNKQELRSKLYLTFYFLFYIVAP